MRALTTNRVAHWAAHSFLPRLMGEIGTARVLNRYRQSGLDKTAAKRTPISAELRERLEAEMEPDVSRLSKLLRRDLASFWFGRKVGD